MTNTRTCIATAFALVLEASSVVHAEERHGGVAAVDPRRAYTLHELIDIAERHHPSSRVYWERAVERARAAGVSESEYFPVLVASAVGADQRIVQPFPKELIKPGYTTFDLAVVEPKVSLDYLLLDFGGRAGRVEATRAAALAANAELVRENQEVAFEVATAFYHLVTAEETLDAARATLETALVTQDAAAAKLETGRATVPDVLDARAAAAQATYDLQAARGSETVAHIQLREAIGAEPSPDIQIARPAPSAAPAEITRSVERLVEVATHERPDLKAALAHIDEARARAKAAESAYLPKVNVAASGGYVWAWPHDDDGALGAGHTWSYKGALELSWTLFDGGKRKNELAGAEARTRELQAAARATEDKVVRQVWSSYVAFTTAEEKRVAASSLLAAASESYSASLDSYRNGVRTIVDVVTAERQLATARLVDVRARSELLLDAVELELSTGRLLQDRGRSAVPR